MSYKASCNIADNTGKTFQFYKKCIEMERRKSINCGDKYSYPLSTEVIDGKASIVCNLHENWDFDCLFRKNADNSITKWPKHLRWGLDIICHRKRYSLLQYVFPFEELKKLDANLDSLFVSLDLFELNPDVAEEMEIELSKINEINSFIRKYSGDIDGLEKIIKTSLDTDLYIERELYLSLTAESIALSQINSELKHLETMKNSRLLDEFLSGHLLNNVADHVDKKLLIHIKDMDDSQRNAVATALNSKISVITGPPGTGKTQMIMNLMANALLKGKSVLVASKNNKAVDNIKDRFDLLATDGYVLRFGARETIQNQLLPFLNSFCLKIRPTPHPSFQYRDEYEFCCRKINENQVLLKELEDKSNDLLICQKKMTRISNELSQVEKRYAVKRFNLKQSYGKLQELLEVPYQWSKAKTVIIQIFNTIQGQYHGIFKLFFNWFRKQKYATEILNIQTEYPEILEEFIQKETGFKYVSDIKNGNDLIVLCKTTINALEKVISLKKSLVQSYEDEKKAKLPLKQSLLSDTELETRLTERINYLSEKASQLKQKVIEDQEKINTISKSLFKELIEFHLSDEKVIERIQEYKNYLPNNIPWRKEELGTFKSITNAFIKIFQLNCVTNLSIKNAFPLSDGIFDFVIIDEASQCDIASAIPLVYRAKQLVVVGDPMQLKHISTILPEEENTMKQKLGLQSDSHVTYRDSSLWDYCNNLISSAASNNRPVVLNNHYRCHRDIIGYSNEMFYARQLGVELKVHTTDLHPEIEEKGIIWIDVKGSQTNPSRNVNEMEVAQAVSLAVQMAEKYPEASIGIISPFRHQAERINTKIPSTYAENERIVADTVHRFQGDEKDIIIYSLMVTTNSPASKIKWIDEGAPNLVNVAVTRARKVLYVIGNKEYIIQNSRLDLPLGYLAHYADYQLN